MTTPPEPDLRTTLHRLADSTVPLPVDDGIWQRARAARRRGQVLLVVAVLVVLASAGGAFTLVSTDREARTASGEVPGGAIPRRIIDIPDDLDATGDLDVGRGSAAFISASNDPVVITAVDGVPHRLELPGWKGGGAQALALSPDGARLAWQAADAEGDRATIGVLDLATGRTDTHTLAPIGPLRLREMSWSPDSVWLACIADASPDAWLGLVRPGTETDSVVYQMRGNIPDVAVNAGGALVFSKASGGLQRIDSRGGPDRLGRGTTPDGVGLGAGRFSPDGKHLALRSSPTASSYTLDTVADDVLEHPFPDGTFEDGFVVPVGWLDDRLQLLLVQESSSPDRVEMVVTTPDVDDTSTWRRSVGVVEAGPATSLSLAVDLVPDLDGTSSQELTHDFGDPLTSSGRDISWIIGLGVAAAIALLLGLRWLWRRVGPPWS